MKTGIFIGLAALALAVVAVPDAYGKSGPDIDWQVSGHAFNVDINEETQERIGLLNLFAKGKPGTANIGARTRATTFAPGNPRCPDGWFGSDLLSQLAVATFPDGSIFTARATAGFTCTPDGDTFFTESTGIITGGTGRFEGASGTWESIGSAQSLGSGVTGTFTADLD